MLLTLFVTRFFWLIIPGVSYTSILLFDLRGDKCQSLVVPIVSWIILLFLFVIKLYNDVLPTFAYLKLIYSF